MVAAPSKPVIAAPVAAPDQPPISPPTPAPRVAPVTEREVCSGVQDTRLEATHIAVIVVVIFSIVLMVGSEVRKAADGDVSLCISIELFES